MKQYFDVINEVLENGNRKPNRTGVDTFSIFNYNFQLDMDDGFPLLTSKKMSWKNIVLENLWFLSGDSKVSWLHKHGVTFWDPWIEDGEYLPKAYGEYWRKYPNYPKPDVMPIDYNYHINDEIRYGPEAFWYNEDNHTFDQFAEIVNRLKKNPQDRRLVLTNWYAPSAYAAILPPCHLMAIFNVQYYNGKPHLNLHNTMRSNDVGLGLPYNIAGYAFLLHLVGALTDLPVKYYGQTSIDMHIYENHVEALKEQVTRTPTELPQLVIKYELTLKYLDELIRDGTTEEIMDHFVLNNYNPQSSIKMEVAV